MATFGFYFGYTFGMMRAVLAIISLGGAILSAMYFTRTTAELIKQTFEVTSPFLPFAAFLITLLVVLMMARIVTKLIEETITNTKFDTISKVIGGLMMSLLFTLLYSGLVVFFGQAHVVPLVFNDDVLLTHVDKDIKLMSISQQDSVNDIILNPKGDSIPFKKGVIPFSIKKGTGKRYTPSINLSKPPILLTEQDSFYFTSKEELQLHANNKEVCFCLGPILLQTKNDSLYFDCTDKAEATKSHTSFFYRYIEVIPRRGAFVMENMLPFVETFFDYMKIALEKLEKGDQRPPKPINVFSTEDNNSPSGQLQEENVYDAPEEPPVEDLPQADSIVIKLEEQIDSTNHEG
jgi:uncharacterized membrane protein required for colicin V production